MPTTDRRYVPHFSYTHQMVAHLMAIEGARRVVDVLPLPPDSAFLLRFEALRRSTHFSTSIEGNQLSLDEVREGIAQADRSGSRPQLLDCSGVAGAAGGGPSAPG